MSSTEHWTTSFKRFLERRGKIQALAELTGVEHMRAMAAESRRNSEAEAAHVRKTVWGETQAADQDQDMGSNTILGDIHQPPTVVVAGQQSSTLTALALALAGLVPVGLGAAGAGAAAAYYLSQPRQQAIAPEVQPPTFEDSSVSIGLGRLEDFEKGDK